MKPQPSPLEEYEAAVALERAAWEAVKANLPGSPSFEHELWKQWRTAVEKADLAAARAKESVSLTMSEAQSPPARKSWPQAVRLSPIFRNTRSRRSQEIGR